MKMKRCTAAILLMLSLEVLVGGQLSAAVAVDGVDTIRLPSHGLAGELVDEVKRPWKCCDHTFCNRKMPPGCRCMDAVVKCDKDCSRCEKSPSDPSKNICMDRYTGDPGPSCTKSGNDLTHDDVLSGPGVAGHDADATEIVVDGEEDASPWKCCDLSRCTKSIPPTCQCLDKVKKCGKACKNCEKAAGSDGAPSRYICWDIIGKIAPRCTKSVASGGPGVAGQEATAAADGQRPWRCCNRPLSIRSDPPTWSCLDDLDGGCWSTCKRCVQDMRDPDSHRCLDEHTGDPGPRCSSLLNSTSLLKDTENRTANARPWKCCDDTMCTRSAPPTCQCLDKVKKCAKTCKVCKKAKESSGASPRYVCDDRYFGWPGDKCTKPPVAADIRRRN